MGLKRRLRCFLAIVPLITVGTVGRLATVHAFPINSPNARTLFGGFNLGVVDFRFTRETGAGQEVNVFEEVFTGVHAVTGDLTLGLTLPVVQKELELKMATGKTSQVTSSGFGDLSLVGVYRFYRRDIPRATTQFSLLGGFKAPTGSTTQSDQNGGADGNRYSAAPQAASAWERLLGRDRGHCRLSEPRSALFLRQRPR